MRRETVTVGAIAQVWRRTAAAAAAASALLGVGCDHHTGVADPCRVLRREEVAAAVGSPVAAGRRVSAIKPGSHALFCVFDTTTAFGEVEVSVQHPGGRQAFARWKHQAQTRGPVPAMATIPKLGDAAFSAGGGVQALRGDSYLIIEAQNIDSRLGPDGFTKVAVALADKAVPRLP